MERTQGYRAAPGRSLDFSPQQVSKAWAHPPFTSTPHATHESHIRLVQDLPFLGYKVCGQESGGIGLCPTGPGERRALVCR